MVEPNTSHSNSTDGLECTQTQTVSNGNQSLFSDAIVEIPNVRQIFIYFLF